MKPIKSLTFLVAYGTIVATGIVEFEKGADENVVAALGSHYEAAAFRRYEIGDRLRMEFRQRSDGSISMASQDLVGTKADTPKVKVEIDQNDNYYLQPEIVGLFQVGMQIAAAEGFWNVMLLGASGYGKTTIASEIAKRNGYEFLRVNCPLIRDPSDWYGSQELVDGAVGTNTKFVFNEMVTMLEKGNCVILLDEINRLETYLSNGLFALLDAGWIDVRGRRITLGGNIVFAATANIGFQYTGTFPMDEALKNRFMAVAVVRAMPVENERKVLAARTGITSLHADRIVRVVTVLREKKMKVDVSTRATLAIAKLMTRGMEIEQAFDFVIGNRCDDVDRKSLADTINLA